MAIGSTLILGWFRQRQTRSKIALYAEEPSSHGLMFFYLFTAQLTTAKTGQLLSYNHA